MPTGTPVGGGVFIDDAVITPAMLKKGAGYQHPLDMLRHLLQFESDCNQKTTDMPAAGIWHLFTARAVGTLLDFWAYLDDTGTATSITFILLKNGVSIMSSALTLVHGDTDRHAYGIAGARGSIASADLPYVAGDIFQLQLTVSSSTAAKGAVGGVTVDQLSQ